MFKQVRNLVVIKISVVTISVALFILMLKIIFTCVKIVAHPRLMPHCGIIWVHITDFRRENNSTPGVLIEEIRYIFGSNMGRCSRHACVHEMGICIVMSFKR